MVQGPLDSSEGASHSPSSGGIFLVAEKVEQSQGEEAEAVGGASGHGCCLCQSGCCQQGDSPFLVLPQLQLGFLFFFFKFDFLAPPSGRSVASYTQTYAQAELAQVQRKV